MFASRSIRSAGIFASLLVVLSMAMVDTAEARRGGFLGSRGTRTFQTAPATPTAPLPTAPITKSVTPKTTAPTTAPRPGVTQPRGGFFGGFGGSILGGLFLGGLIGMFMGHGFGGIGGLFGLVFQLLLIFGVVSLLMRFFRNRQQPAMAGGPRGYAQANPYAARNYTGGSAGANTGSRSRTRDEVGVTNADLDQFERMLTEIQAGYAREDRAALSRLVTPEILNYFGEEIQENARNGVRNEVRDVKLLQGDLSEAWREGNTDYATVAMRYSSVDFNADRRTGRPVAGASERPSETTEVWTFTRQRGGSWVLSAIQDAQR